MGRGMTKITLMLIAILRQDNPVDGYNNDDNDKCYGDEMAVIVCDGIPVNENDGGKISPEKKSQAGAGNHG